jgi:hypothetical protein
VTAYILASVGANGFIELAVVPSRLMAPTRQDFFRAPGGEMAVLTRTIFHMQKASHLLLFTTATEQRRQRN